MFAIQPSQVLYQVSLILSRAAAHVSTEAGALSLQFKWQAQLMVLMA